MKSYKVLNKQVYSFGVYSMVPIRMEDQYEIMNWRNEQLYHLRQQQKLTINDQDKYFSNVVQKLFNEKRPDQILFSFLKKGEIITERNVRSIRPGFGLHPKFLPEIIGKKTTKEAFKGDRFDLDMIK